MAHGRQKGVLLLNLGTPDSTEVAAVRRYLREFLSNPRVVDINPVGRWLLLNFVILPFRPKKSAHAYRQIWTDEGSPLLVHGKALAQGLQRELGDAYRVALGMRYGQPSTVAGLRELLEASVSEISVVPLFPQYSSAATGSAVENCLALLGQELSIPHVHVHSHFFEHPAFIHAFTDRIRSSGETVEHTVFSYHGLPERQILAADPTEGEQHCLKSDDCCERFRAEAPLCYRAQCFATTGALAGVLGLETERFSTTFQSRLGRVPWIQPYTDEALDRLRADGVSRVRVVCPAFVADCLETLEEIGMQAKERWLAQGGSFFELVPSLNANESWVKGLAEIVAGDRSQG